MRHIRQPVLGRLRRLSRVAAMGCAQFGGRRSGDGGVCRGIQRCAAASADDALRADGALSLGDAGRPIAHKILAPFYSMGLFHATKKRRTVSWSVSFGVFVLVGLVKRLPYPWRAIVDAGVCTGLCWGGASILAISARALGGTTPSIDPELP